MHIRAEGIIVPAILPDELAHGYVGRIKTINILSSVSSTTTFLEDAFLTEDARKSNARRVLAIAKAAELTLEQLCQQHTLMPFLRATTNISHDLNHGAPDNLALIQRSAFRLAMESRMVCPECVKEDLNFWGFSYWRRRHQLPGVIWCDKHRVKLLPSASEFDVCPSAEAIPDDYCKSKSFDDCVQNPIINRYVEIVSGFLEMRHPLSFSEAAKKLSHRAQKMGIRVCEKGRRPTLSDVALESAPKSWLSSLFPRIEMKIPGERFSAIDRVLLHEGLPQARALALALMFDSAEEALQYWSESLVEDLSASGEHDLKGQDYWNSKKIFVAYVKHQGVRSDIAKSIGAHPWRVSDELNRAGLPSLSGVQFETTGSAIIAFYDGLPLTEACAIYGADLKVCENLVRNAGARFVEALRRIRRRKSSKSIVAKVVSGNQEQFSPTQKAAAAI